MAAEAGATDLVGAYPGTDLAALQTAFDRAAHFGLKLSTIERLWPHDKIVHNKPGREQQIEDTKQLIRNMGATGVQVLCYNWMPADDWSRTSTETPTRGGSLVTAFDIQAKEAALDSGAADYRAGLPEEPTSADALWANLESFLKEVLPVAEEAGVVLAMHPDDPPMPEFRGNPQIMTSTEAMVKCAELVPSPSNGLCYCQGTFASAGEDIPSGIKRCAPYIKYVHFRDVTGSVKPEDGQAFTETWHDMGKTNMVSAIETYYACGLRDIPIRPDHVPTMDGETNDHPGYEMLGRLWALGYMKGLMESAAHTGVAAAQ